MAVSYSHISVILSLGFFLVKAKTLYKDGILATVQSRFRDKTSGKQEFYDVITTA